MEPKLSLYVPCEAKPITETLSIQQGKVFTGSWTRRWEGKPQFLLTQLRLEQVFIIPRVEVVYILMKRVGKPMTIHEKIWSICTQQECNTFHIQSGAETTLNEAKFSLLHQEVKERCYGLWSKYELAGVLGSLSQEGMQGVPCS